MLNMTQRVKHCNFLWCSIWFKEGNTAILCEAERDKHCRIVLWRWPWRVMLSMKQRGIHCRLVFVLNSTEKQIAMEVCEELMREMPKCSKHEWRHKGGRGVGGLLSGFRFLSCGLMFGRWAFVRLAFVPVPSQVYPKETLTHFPSPQEPELFFHWTLFQRGLSVRVMIGLASVLLCLICSHNFWWPWYYRSWKCQKSETTQSLNLFQ